jgi:hypothetical protein
MRYKTPKEKSLDRRQLLKLLGSSAVGSSALGSLFSGLVSGMAYGQATNNTARNYVHLSMVGGPPRWMFDQFLHPYTMPNSDTVFVPNGQVKTGFDPVSAGSPNLVPSYKWFSAQVAGETLHLPQLWSCTLPRPDGSSVPMTELLNHMFTLRGVDLQKDGHSLGRVRQLLPANGRGSLDGLVADKSETPMPTVAVDLFATDGAFQSPKGIGQPVWNRQQGDNPISQYLAPFQYPGSLQNDSIFLRRKNLDQLVDLAIEAIGKRTQLLNPETGGIVRDGINARRLLRENFSNLPTMYYALRAKYYDLQRRCQNRDIVGINDRAIPPAGLTDVMRTVQSTNGLGAITAINPDLRDILIPSYAAVASLGDACATAELLLGMGYSAAVTSVIGAFGVNIMTANDNTYFGFSPDEHITGSGISVIVNTFYYRALAACLLELISAFKAKGIFENTVVHLTSEFPRMPRNDGAGSDHGVASGLYTLFSGAFSKPLVVGNIQVDSPLPGYSGTWGLGANVYHEKTMGVLNLGHGSSTVADLLRVRRPLPNFSSVLSETSQGVQSVIEEAKNVKS